MREPQAPVVSPRESPRLVVGFVLGNWLCVTKTSHVSPAAAGATCLQTLSENPTSRIDHSPLSPWPQMSYKPQAFLLQYTRCKPLTADTAMASASCFFCRYQRACLGLPGLCQEGRATKNLGRVIHQLFLGLAPDFGLEHRFANLPFSFCCAAQ